MAGGANDFSLIESLVSKLPRESQEDARSLFQGWSSQLSQLNTSTGNSPGGNAQNAAAPPPPGLSVTGANGTFTVTMTPPAGVQGALWYELSYSATKGFGSGVTTLPPTAATQMTLNLPGQGYFFRVRVSQNRTVWSDYATASQTAVNSGLVSSAATANGAAFAQTNYGTVTSVAEGGTAAVQIQGAGGALTSLVAVKGGTESILPGATEVGVALGSTQFVGYGRAGYTLQPTLAAVLQDGYTPIGKVSVVNGGTPRLPTVKLVLGSGGAVLGWNVIDGGDGLTGPVNLTITTSTGTGATAGAQAIQAGVLISIAPGNPGSGYASADTVNASGGIGPGESGGGTSAGGNGGRLTNV